MFGSLDELNRHLSEITNKENNKALTKFEGYSPIEMNTIIYDTFGTNSPIQLKRLTEIEYQSIPILNQIKYLLEIIQKQGELKLTSKGYLPTKIVADIYSKKFIVDKDVENGLIKLYKETDSISINITRILVEISGLAKKRNNKLSLTKLGEKNLSNNFTLLEIIFKTFGHKFNWAFYDLYTQMPLGQIGFGFTLILLSKYGNTKQPVMFYSEKYFAAFPQLVISEEEPGYSSREIRSNNCYSIRSFDRFFDFFGLIIIEHGKSYLDPKQIDKSSLFDKLIKIHPHVDFSQTKTTGSV